MSASMRRLLLGTVALLSSCAAPQRKEHPIVNLAVFDLNCPKAQLTYAQIDEKNWGVAGCGQRVRYVEMCRRNQYNLEECQWVSNGSTAPQK
jgi:hypothetical protein